MSELRKAGRFVVFEGGEGAGKSTQIKAACELLKEQSISYVQTREPGGTEVGEEIRRVLLDKKLPAMHMDTELLLMFAARAEHLQKTILPALEEGKWVLCDRFTDASYAYQGYGRGVASERLEALESWVEQTLRPDLVMIFDIDVRLGLERVSERGAKDRFEEEQIEFFERVRHGYLERAKASPAAYAVLDAALDRAEVTTEVRKVLQVIIDQWSHAK